MLCAVLLVLLVLLACRTTTLFLADIWSQWGVGEYTHGYLVLAISLYLVFERRHRLASLVPCPSYAALPVLLAGSMAWLVAAAVHVQLVQAAALLLMIVSVLWAALGTRAARLLLYPLLFIGFALPVWSPLSPLLQQFTADVVFRVARLLDIPVLRREHLLVLPDGQLSIREACAGLRFLLAGTALATLYAGLNYSGLRARLLVVASGTVAALLANVVRVVIVVYIAAGTGMQHPLVRDHLLLGWVVFACTMAVLLLMDTVLAHHRSSGAVHVSPPEDTDAVGPCARGYVRRLPAVLLAALLAGAAPVIAAWLQQSAAPASAGTPVFPEGRAGWSGPSAGAQSCVPVYHGAQQAHHAYRKGNHAVLAYIGVYHVQRQGNELINELNRLCGAPGWKPVYSSARTRQVAGRQVAEFLYRHESGEERLVWYWYRIAGMETTHGSIAKLYELFGLLSGRPAAMVVVVSTDTGEDTGEARAVLDDFVVAMADSLSIDADRTAD